MFHHNTFKSAELFRWISIGLNYLQHCQFKNASIIKTCNLNRPYYHVASEMMQIVRHTYTTSYKQQTICNFFNRYWIDSKFLFLHFFSPSIVIMHHFLICCYNFRSYSFVITFYASFIGCMLSIIVSLYFTWVLRIS